MLERERADFGERARMLFGEFDQPFAVAEEPPARMTTGVRCVREMSAASPAASCIS